MAFLLNSGCLSVSLAQDFAPAILTGLNDAERLSCPGDPEKIGAIFCHVSVSEQGEVDSRDGARCYSNDRNDGRQIRRVEKVLESSSFRPASIDGHQVPVSLTLRVLSRKTGDDCSLAVLHNLGFQRDQLGDTYIAPQEVLSDGGWLERAFRGRIEISNIAGGAFIISVAVAADGKAGDGRVEGSDLIGPDMPLYAVRELQNSQFIPAMVDGRTINARYFEHFYHYGTRGRPGRTGYPGADQRMDDEFSRRRSGPIVFE